VVAALAGAASAIIKPTINPNTMPVRPVFFCTILPLDVLAPNLPQRVELIVAHWQR
jgi:hypothetical protein